MMLPIDPMCCQFSGASLNVLYTHVTQVHMKGSSVLKDLRLKQGSNKIILCFPTYVFNHAG